MNSKEHNELMEIVKLQNEKLLKLDMEKCKLKDELRDKNILVQELRQTILEKKNKKKKIIKKKDNHGTSNEVIDWTGGLDF